MNELLLLGMLLLFACVAYLIRLPRRVQVLYADWQAFQAWRCQHTNAELPSIPVTPPTAEPLPPSQQELLAALDGAGPPEIVEGCGRALLAPPNLDTAIAMMRREAPDAKAGVPFGWYRYDETADLAFTDLVSETYHIGLGGISRHGKTRLVFQFLFALAAQRSPEELQWCLFDLKRLDFPDFAGKAHTWRLVLKPEQISPTIQALTEELDRRGDLLNAARVTDWADYQGADMPLLLVYISELSTLKLAMGNTLDSWMNDLLSRGAGYGVRVIVDTQNFSNYSTHWRGNIAQWICGPLKDDNQNEANTGLQTKSLLAAGAIPPSRISTEWKGVFTSVNGSQAITVRTSPLSNEERLQRIDALPVAGSSVEMVRETIGADETRFISSVSHEPRFAPVMGTAVSAETIPSWMSLVNHETIGNVERCRKEKLNKKETIRRVWNATAGGTDRYKLASDAYDYIIGLSESKSTSLQGASAAA